MKKLFLFLFLITSVYAEIKYYACVDCSTGQIKSSWKFDSSIENLKSVSYPRYLFEITESEYDSNSIDPAKIASAITTANSQQKDINKVSKLEKAAFLVIMDYLRKQGLLYTNAKFRNDVMSKFDSL